MKSCAIALAVGVMALEFSSERLGVGRPVILAAVVSHSEHETVEQVGEFHFHPVMVSIRISTCLQVNSFHYYRLWRFASISLLELLSCIALMAGFTLQINSADTKMAV